MLWKEIRGHEGVYLISSGGRVFNQKTHQYLKPSKKSNGYYHVCLCYGERKDYLVHRLVAEYFIPNPLNFPQVNHKDENKLNNSVDNLEWCTSKYNVNYGKGSTARNQRVIQYDMNGNAIKIWNSIKEASEALNIKYQGISRCCRNMRKSTGGYIWTYANISNVRLKWKAKS